MLISLKMDKMDVAVGGSLDMDQNFRDIPCFFFRSCDDKMDMLVEVQDPIGHWPLIN